MASPSSDKAIEHLETVRKKRVALERRLQKVSHRAIADELGVSVSTVQNYIREMTVTMLPPPEAEELRIHEAANIDTSEERANACIRMLMIQAQNKQRDNLPVHVELTQIKEWEAHVINLRKQRSLLLGINLPVKVEHTHKIRTEFDEEVESLVSELTGGGKVMSMPDNLDVGDEIA